MDGPYTTLKSITQKFDEAMLRIGSYFEIEASNNEKR